MHSPLSLRLAALCLAVFTLSFAACDSGDPDDDLPEDTDLLAEAAANPGTWFFIEAEGLKCRDNSATGFGVRLQEGATNLAIYLEGGGACFNEATCGSNPSSFTRANFDTFVAGRGDVALFSTSDANPIGDWNAVYVPYCTGDVHGGSAPNSFVVDVEDMQQFVGHQNIETIVGVLDAELDAPAKVLLTGSSAGGFGSLINFPTVADAFGDSDLYLVDDSGPIFFADEVFSPQLGSGLSLLYRLSLAFPSDADALFQPDGLQNIYDYHTDRYPEATLALSSYLQDATIRGFFGFGQADGTITGEEFANGLEEIRDEAEAWGTYYVPGETHTFLPAPDRYFGTNGSSTTYADWLGAILDGDAQDVSAEATRIAVR